MSRTTHDLSVRNKPLIDTCQYCSTSRANQALRSLVNAGFQNRGVCLQAFPSFPSPLPFLIYCSRAVKTENPVPRSFFAPKLNGNVCYTGYWMIKMDNLPQFQNIYCHMTYFTSILSNQYVSGLYALLISNGYKGSFDNE